MALIQIPIELDTKGLTVPQALGYYARHFGIEETAQAVTKAQ